MTYSEGERLGAEEEDDSESEGEWLGAEEEEEGTTLEQEFATRVEYWLRHQEFLETNALPCDQEWKELQRILVSDSFLRGYKVLDCKIYPRRLILGFRVASHVRQVSARGRGCVAKKVLFQHWASFFFFFRMRAGDARNRDVMICDLAVVESH